MVGVRQLRRGDDLLVGRLELAVADVLHHGGPEQVRVLEHEPELSPQIALLQVADVRPVDLDRPLVHVVEPGEQVDHGGLSGARRSDERDGLAGLRFERDVVEDLRALAIAERHVIEANASADRLDRLRLGGVVRLGGRVDDLEDALGACQRALQHVVEVRERAERLHEVLPVVDERRDDPDGDEALEREPPAEACEHDHEEVSEHAGERHEEERVRVRVHARAINLLVLGAERREHRLVPTEDGHDLLPTDGLLHHAIQRTEVLLQLGEALAREHGDEAREPEHNGNDEQRREREPPVEHEHRDEDAEHREHAGEQRRDVLRDGLIDRVDVVGEPAHQLARRIALEEIHRQGLEVLEQVLAQPFERAL